MAELCRCGAFSLGCGPPLGNFLFHFLIGLPKKEIGRDRGTQDGNQHHEGAMVPLHGGMEGIRQHFGPIRLARKAAPIYVNSETVNHLNVFAIA